MITELNHISPIKGEYSQGSSQGYKSTQEKQVNSRVESGDVLVKISDAAKERQKQESETGIDRPGKEQLSEEEKRIVEQLKKVDMETKAHEKAHLAAGSGLVQGGASFTYTRGPDGRMYAVGGEVSIDTSPENDPDATIRKMQQVKRAAMAPSSPSGQDRSVAAQAAQTEADARAQKMEESREAMEKNNSDEPSPTEHDPVSPYDNPTHPSVEKGFSIDLAV